LLNTSTNQEELKHNWTQLSALEKALPTVLKRKEELKAKL
jgi:hypothetical protein